MTERSLAKLACRILALYAFFQVAASLPASVIALSIQRDASSPTMTLTSTLLAVTAGTLLGNLLAGSALWFGASRIAGWMAPEGASAEGLEYRALQTLAFSVVGLVLVVHAIPLLITYAAYLFDVQVEDLRKYWSGLAGQTVGFVLGLSLLLRAKGITTALHRLSSSTED